MTSHYPAIYRGLRFKRVVAASLALLIAFTPLSPLMVVKAVAPVSSAQAADANDLVSCLNIAGAAIGGAAEIAKAVANPEYTACIAEAAAGSVLTIGMMAAVTALWATDTSSFDNPGECKQFISSTLLGYVAKGIMALLGGGEGVLGDLLKSIIGQDGINLIKDLAKYAGVDFDSEIANAKDAAAKEAAEQAKKLFEQLTETFSEIATPLMHSLNCGCAAAGTVAIIKNVGEGVAKSADSCWEVLKDPAAVLQALLDDPGAVAKAAVGAACDAVKEAVDVCGFASDVYDTLKQACDIPGVDYMCEGAGKIGHAAYCLFFDCDESKPYDPLAGANSRTCELGEFDSASDWFNGCKCPPPYGKTAWTEYYVGSMDINSSDPTASKASPHEGMKCVVCDANEGTYKAADGDSYCVKCALGMTSRNPDGSVTADGSCSVPLKCGDDQRLNVSTNSCFSCKPGTHFSPDGQTCWPDCPTGMVNIADSYGQCRCPPSADGKYQAYDAAAGQCIVPVSCDPSYQTITNNTCELICPDNTQYAAQQGEFITCKTCPDGKVAVNNKCVYLSGTTAVAQCGPDQIHNDGTCETCPYGTQKGEGNTCDAVCPAGSAPKKQAHVALTTLLNAASRSVGAAAAGMMQPGALTDAAAKAAAGNMTLAKPPKAGDHTGPATLADKICVKCGENEQSVTLTNYGNGYSISKQACMKCPDGQVSSPGGKCHKPVEINISVFTPQRPSDDRRDRRERREQAKDKPRTSKADPQGQPKLDGTPALPKGSDTQAPRPKPKCPPGQIPSDGGCRTPQAKGAPAAPELDMPGFGGGSSMPGFPSSPGGRRGGGAAPTPPPPPSNPKPF